MSKNKLYIWDGIYEEFSSVISEEDAFESERWIKDCKSKADDILKIIEGSEKVESASNTHDQLMVLTAIESIEKGMFKILDFGGGLGLTYFNIIKSISMPDDIEYHIVENEKLVNIGNEIYTNYKNLYFNSELPNKDQKFDIIYFGSSLHYVEDWAGLLNSVVAYKPKYIVFSDLVAGKIKSFVTAQNYYGDKIPVWFWNINEFKARLLEMKYKNIFIAENYTKDISEEMSNFPAEYRLNYTKNMIFKIF